MPIETLSVGGSMLGTLTKSDIISIQTENGYSLRRSIEIAETRMEIIKHTLEFCKDVMFLGFGKFQVTGKKERRGRIPVTGNNMIFPARKVVKFTSYVRLRDRIDRK